jgi:hypothetical protein
MIRVAGCLVGLLVGCGGAGGPGEQGAKLQSTCVLQAFGIKRTVPDGADCTNVSISSCGVGAWGSECTGYCAFELCQSVQCDKDADCTSFGATRECLTYAVSSKDYGRWCGRSSCPRGTSGCPCRDGAICVEGICNAAGKCEVKDSCPTGCRAGSVCCGGAFCAGNCIGTPCC